MEALELVKKAVTALSDKKAEDITVLDIHEISTIADYFIIGFRIILPVFCCILVINIVLGILAKIAPQMNMFVIGMQLKIIVGLFLIFLTLQLFGNVADYMFDEMHNLTKYFIQNMKP